MNVSNYLLKIPSQVLILSRTDLDVIVVVRLLPPYKSCGNDLSWVKLTRRTTGLCVFTERSKSSPTGRGQRQFSTMFIFVEDNY